MRGSKRGWKGAVSGSVPTIGSANLSLERGPEKGGFEASERVYDPLWTNARTLLDFLAERDLVRRNLKEARIGQFVLASGPLSVMDFTLWKGIWTLPALKNAMREGFGQQTSSQPEQNRANRRRDRGKTSSDTSSPKSVLENQLESAFSLLGMLPHTVQARLRVNGDEVVWCSLREDGLVVSASDLTLKHGATVSGRWNMLGVLDALPDGNEADKSTGLEAFGVGDPFGPSPFGDLMLTMTPAVRGLLGRPSSAYGMTPLMIFREISS